MLHLGHSLANFPLDLYIRATSSNCLRFLYSQPRSRCNRSYIFYPLRRKSPRFEDFAKPWGKERERKKKRRWRVQAAKYRGPCDSRSTTAILTVSICLIDTPTSALRPHGNRFEDNDTFHNKISFDAFRQRYFILSLSLSLSLVTSRTLRVF